MSAEVTMKEFRVNVAKQLRISECAAHYRIHDPKQFPGLVFRYVNPRVVFVSGPPIDEYVQTKALHNGAGDHSID